MTARRVYTLGSFTTLWHDHIACIDDTACAGKKQHFDKWACTEPWTCQCNELIKYAVRIVAWENSLTFRDATTCFPAKWRPRKEYRNTDDMLLPRYGKCFLIFGLEVRFNFRFNSNPMTYGKTPLTTSCNISPFTVLLAIWLKPTTCYRNFPVFRTSS